MTPTTGMAVEFFIHSTTADEDVYKILSRFLSFTFIRRSCLLHTAVTQQSYHILRIPFGRLLICAYLGSLIYFLTPVNLLALHKKIK
jgi:hypothetical protein